MWTVLKINAILMFAAGILFGGPVIVSSDNFWQRVFGPVEQHAVSFETMTLPERSNDFLACPESLCANARPDLSDTVIGAPVKEVRGRFFELVFLRPRAELIGMDALADQYEVRETTSVFGFPDTITIRFYELTPDRTAVAIYSRSHYGTWDFGLNEKRVRAWLAWLRHQNLPTS